MKTTIRLFRFILQYVLLSSGFDDLLVYLDVLPQVCVAALTRKGVKPL
jgi:hypothetical protein